MEVYLGTGGYSNSDWLGLLYPTGTKPAKYLDIYAQHFNAVELNSSFYAIPGIKAFEGMVRKSKAGLRFAVKIHQSMTHSRDASEDMYSRLFESVEPLRQAGMLAPFLAQFPYSFHRTPANRRYLAALVERFKGQPLAVEFRNGDWHRDRVVKSFKEMGLILVSVDYPQVGKVPEPKLYVTSDIAYVRLHGRNTEKWWDGKSASERHDYLYSPEELRPWVQDIAERKEELSQAYVLLQNTTKGHALKNAVMLVDLFKEVGLELPRVPLLL